MIRRITSKEDEAKKTRRNQIVVGIVLVVLMLFSILGYSFGSNPSTSTSQTVEYNGYNFTSSGGLWSLSVGETAFGFASHPKNAYKTTSSLKSLTNYYGKPLYIYSESADAESEIYRNLYGVSDRVDSVNDTAAKTCADNFIIIREKSVARISQDGGCVFMDGPSDDLIKITDGFLLKIIGVN